MRPIAMLRAFLRELHGSPVMRQSGLIVANNFVLAAAGYVYFLVLGRNFSPAVVGESAALLGIATVIALIARLGADASLFHFLPASGHPFQLLRLVFVITEAAAFLVSGIALLILGRTPPINGVIGIGALLLLLGVTTSFTNIIDFGLMAVRRTEWMLVRNVAAGIVKVTLPIGLISIGFHPTLGTLLMSLLASNLVGALLGAPLLWLAIRQRAVGSEPLPTIRELAGYASANHFASIFQALPALVLPILLVVTTSSEASAYFYVASNLSGIVMVLPYALSQATFIHISHKRAGAMGNDSGASTGRQFWLAVAGSVAFSLVAPILLIALGRSYLANSLSTAIVLGFSTPAILIANLYAVELRTRARHLALLVFTGGSAFMIIAASLIGVRLAGLLGLGFGWFAAALVNLLVAQRLRHRP